jgi:signal transduction histidine kinase/FtsH-binding integral membrane protein
MAVATVAAIAPLALYLTASGAAWRGRLFPGFFVVENRTIPTVGGYDWTGLRADVPFHGRVVAVDGRAVRDNEEVYEHAAALPAGSPVRYTFVKNGAEVERTVATMRFRERDFWMTTGLFALNGWLYLGAAALVLFLQPARRAAHVFFAMGINLTLFALTAAALYRSPGPWLAVVHFTTQALFPATFVHLACMFPVERSTRARRLRLLAVPYALSTVLAIASIRGFFAEPPDLRPLYPVWIYAALSILTLCATSAYAYFEHRSSSLVRRQARIVTVGLVTATVLAVFGFLDNARNGGHFPMNFIAVTPVLFFASVGYAILRHELFDVDRLVRYALEYITLTLAITLAYAGVLLAAERIAGPGLGHAPVFTVAFIVALAFAFAPLRGWVQALLDRTFFRNRPDYRRTLREVSEVLTTILDLGEVVTRVGEALSRAFAAERVVIELWHDGVPECAWSSDNQTPAPLDPTSAVRRRLEGDHRPLTAGALLPDSDPALGAEMERVGAVLLVPLVISAQVLGYVGLGQRRSGRGYDREDLELVVTMANQAAIAVQNARSYRLLQELNRGLEEKISARTRELEHSNDALGTAYQRLQAAQAQLIQAEKMASLGELVAGVAHELNNPLTFIVGNIAPITEQLEALRTVAHKHADELMLAICDDMAQILAVIASGAERTATIVKDLRTFSRIEEGVSSLADLRAGLRTTISLLQPRWKDRIAIHAELDDLPLVECDAGHINQVFMNIISNACDAIRGPGNIWIRAQAQDGEIAVAIRDDGVGIAPEHVARIFDPFFTTKDIGTGTGLGLAISHGIVQRHQGRITVTSARGQGSEFVVHLPVRVESRRRSVA